MMGMDSPLSMLPSRHCDKTLCSGGGGAVQKATCLLQCTGGSRRWCVDNRADRWLWKAVLHQGSGTDDSHGPMTMGAGAGRGTRATLSAPPGL